jgi:hypothetical protein
MIVTIPKNAAALTQFAIKPREKIVNISRALATKPRLATIAIPAATHFPVKSQTAFTPTEIPMVNRYQLQEILNPSR